MNPEAVFSTVIFSFIFFLITFMMATGFYVGRGFGKYLSNRLFGGKQ